MTSLLHLPDELLVEIADWLNLDRDIPLPRVLDSVGPIESTLDALVSAAPNANDIKHSAYWNGPHATGSYALRSTCQRLRMLVPLHSVEYRLPVGYTSGDLARLTSQSESSRAATSFLRRIIVDYGHANGADNSSPLSLSRTVFTLLDAFRGLELLDLSRVKESCWMCDAHDLDIDAARILDTVKNSRLKIIKLNAKESCGMCAGSQQTQPEQPEDTRPPLSPFFFLAAPHLETLQLGFYYHQGWDTTGPWNVLVEHTPAALSNLTTLQCVYYWPGHGAIADICHSVPRLCPRVRHLSITRTHYYGHSPFSPMALRAVFTSLSSDPSFPQDFCQGFTPSHIGQDLSAFNELVQCTLNVCIMVYIQGRGRWDPFDIWDDVHAAAVSEYTVRQWLQLTNIQEAVANYAPAEHRTAWIASVTSTLFFPSVRAVLKSAKMISASCPSLRRGNLFIERNPFNNTNSGGRSNYIECNFTVGDQPGTIASLTTSDWPCHNGEYDLLQYLDTAPQPTFDSRLQKFLIGLAKGRTPKTRAWGSLFGRKGRV